ncbi:hypothetical protein TSTA_004590 [Talaromyces stipitatus ATCC 10500]|uniref:Uncharacterized protein n=1 Tax=Talaromyces stipitatus (strain ATCC 10500 / CBS 375.48 / QM 6759 / NRRL 1006) TaxID=441959 RepID=B8MTK7_TALSN|nr:uncharacterized protein TSTA_004590 [Talaromyces stipitatus ATCC 10500]EED12413.1 hypothetical protein TSTA_004590 [Talaromyces stipitatus ATCC 10500]
MTNLVTNSILPHQAEGQLSSNGITAFESLSDVHSIFQIINAIVSNQSYGSKATNTEDWINRVPGRGFIDPSTGMDFPSLQKLGWTQSISLDDGIKRTVGWYKENGMTWWGDLQKILNI